MHAEPATIAQGEETQTQTEVEDAEREVAARVFGSIMDVLMPARPPEPKNARIVRQFDVEVAKTDSQPSAEPAPVKRPQPERRSREEARAFRNRSLRAAAGLD